MATAEIAEVSDEDFREILAQTRQFVRSAVVPREQEILDEDRVPDDLRDEAKRMGLFGYAIPQEWGGLGLNLMQDVELAMELGYTSLALRSMFGTNNGIAGQVLVGFGTDEQKSRWLESIASGDVVASFALTEPGAGSNPAGLRTKAVRDGDNWVISGQKRFITNAPVANLFVVFARTRPADDKGPGIAVFLVPADAAGVQVGAKDAKMGQEGAWTADVAFDDVRVDDAALIGGSEDIGYRAAMTSLARGRVHIAALAVGAAQRRARRIRHVCRHGDAGRGGDRKLPVGAGDARRPAGRRDGRPRAGAGRRAAVGHRSGPQDRALGGQAVLHRNGRQCRGSRGADPRRQRLHARRCGRTHLPRRAPAAALRGHQRDSAPDHRIESGQGGGADHHNEGALMAGRLAGKVALITGAARGQGRAHAVRMASEGADIIAVDIAGKLPSCVPYDPASPDDLSETVRLVEETNRRIIASVVDTRDFDGLRRVVADGVAALGRLDIIVANAGVAAPQAWDDITPEDFRDVMDINVTGTWNTVMAGADKIIEGGRGGSIILISSAAGMKMQPFMIHYTASKHAVTGLARAFAAELGKHSIRVNSVHPGPVNTPMGSGDMVTAVGKTMETNPQLSHVLTPFLPDWVAEPEEIADTVCWLASDESRKVTAAQIPVDQGSTQY